MFSNFITSSFQSGDYYIVDMAKEVCIFNFHHETWEQDCSYDHDEILQNLSFIFDCSKDDVFLEIRKFIRDYNYTIFDCDIIMFCVDL